MLHSRSIEIWVGIFVAAGLAALLMLAMKVSNLSDMTGSPGYSLTARFENVSGLKVRAPVTIGGVRVGRVTDIAYDQKGFQAVVTMRVEHAFDQLPLDTNASVLTSGLLGEKYVGLEPGGDTEVLEEGGEIQLTQSSLVLENLIGQFLFSKGSEDKP